jgi:hypothetical protein
MTCRVTFSIERLAAKSTCLGFFEYCAIPTVS